MHVPFRFTFSENRAAYKELKRRYDDNIVGMVLEGILNLHKEKKITYCLSDEAERVFEVIIDKLNDQFNLKYTATSQIPPSQPDLNSNEKCELSVRTKDTEIIGHLTCVLWVYCNGKYLKEYASHYFYYICDRN